MRVKEEFKKWGKFWLPSTPEHRIVGTLTISEGGNIELEILETLHRDLNNAFNVDEFKRIIGQVEGGDFVTLDDCFYKFKSHSFNEISKSLVYANRVFIGVRYEENDIAFFNSVSFSVEGIDEWVGKNGFEESQDVEKKKRTIIYTKPENIQISLNNNMKLLIGFSSTFSGVPNVKEMTMTQKVSFKLMSEDKRTFDEFNDIIHKITTFLCFAIDKLVCLEEVIAISDEFYHEFDSGRLKYPLPIKIYYSSLPYHELPPKIYPHKMLFKFEQIENVFEKMVNQWIDAYEKIDVVFNLYFSTKMEHQKYSDGKFLALAQGLESYHRRTSTEKLMEENKFEELTASIVNECPEAHKEWLEGRLKNGNDIGFRKRIQKIIEPFKDVIGNTKQRNKIINNVVVTRNYLTHLDESLEEKAVKGMDLHYLCLKIEAILQLHFLDVAGFTTDEIKSIFNDSYELQRKLKN